MWAKRTCASVAARTNISFKNVFILPNLAILFSFWLFDLPFFFNLFCVFVFFSQFTLRCLLIKADYMSNDLYLCLSDFNVFLFL